MNRLIACQIQDVNRLAADILAITLVLDADSFFSIVQASILIWFWLMGRGEVFFPSPAAPALQARLTCTSGKS
ncbi:hypothetical protein ACFS4T_16585 [Pseudomonas lini]